jgi:hypothetical protein
LTHLSLYNKKRKLVILCGVLILVVGIMILRDRSSSTTTIVNNDTVPTFATLLSGRDEEKHTVPLDQIVSGGPPPDGIRSIDSPKFVSAEEANEILQDSDLVVGLDVNGDVRAYPLQILVWHEIVNDNVGGMPVAVTYCPLCFTNQVFNRTINGTMGEFGTSGKLYNSNLVMYDRTSKSLWSQALGEGIVGQYAGVKLERIPFDLAYWKDWKQLYPNTKVLSRDTESTRPYGADPYGDYYASSEVLFPVSNRDDRLALKEIVVGLENAGVYKAYNMEDIQNQKVVNDQVNKKSVVLYSLYPFMVRAYDPIVNGNDILKFEYDAETNNFIDNQTRSHWNLDGISIDGPLKGTVLERQPFDEGYWFEWVAFHPKTEIYQVR